MATLPFGDVPGIGGAPIASWRAVEASAEKPPAVAFRNEVGSQPASRERVADGGPGAKGQCRHVDNFAGLGLTRRRTSPDIIVQRLACIATVERRAGTPTDTCSLAEFGFGEKMSS